MRTQFSFRGSSRIAKWVFMRSPWLLVASILLLLHASTSAQELDYPPDVFDTPAHKGHCIDVTKAPYLCDSTGKQDCSAAIQQAINDISTGADKPRQQTLYFPNGTYLISKTIDGVRTDKTNVYRLRIVGQSETGTTIKLGDASPNFQNPAALARDDQDGKHLPPAAQQCFRRRRVEPHAGCRHQQSRGGRH